MDASVDAPQRSFAFGLEQARPRRTEGAGRHLLRSSCWSRRWRSGACSLLQVDDSLSELFRTDTEEFRRYEEIDRRFPSSEYDVLVVVEGKDLLKKPQLEAFRRAIIDLQLADGVDGLISMLSARGKPDAIGLRAADRARRPARRAGLRRHHRAMRSQRYRQGQVPLRRRRAGAGRPRARPQGGGRRRAPRRSSAASATSCKTELGPRRPQVAPDRRAGHAARDPQRGGARPARLQRPGPPVRRHHRRDLLQARLADAACRAAAGAGRAVVAGAARLARASASTCSSTS